MKTKLFSVRSARALALAVSLCSALTVAVQAESPSAPRPLTLEAALNYAAAHNPALLRTKEQISEQEGVLVEARAGQLPTVAASGSYRRTDDGLLESPLYSDRGWTIDVKARQVLYAGGGVTAQISGQRERLEAVRLLFTAALNDTLFSVRQQFYAVLLNRELIGVQEEAMTVLKLELTNARNRREAGAGSDFDVLRAEVAVANAQPALIRACNTYRVAQDRLRATLGAPASDPSLVTELEVQGELTVPHRNIALVEAVTTARAQRPELLQSERLIKSAELAIRGARSGYLPTVSAVAGYEWTRPSLAASQLSHLDGWTAGVQANWNIFDGRQTAGRISQARSRANQARYTAEERQLGVEVEVRQAHSSLLEAVELLSSSTKVVEQARESLRLSQVRFSAGSATQLDVLSAQSALTLARSNFAQAQHAYAVALAALQRAMGLPQG